MHFFYFFYLTGLTERRCCYRKKKGERFTGSFTGLFLKALFVANSGEQIYALSRNISKIQKWDNGRKLFCGALITPVICYFLPPTTLLHFLHLIISLIHHFLRRIISLINHFLHPNHLLILRVCTKPRLWQPLAKPLMGGRLGIGIHSCKLEYHISLPSLA